LAECLEPRIVLSQIPIYIVAGQSNAGGFATNSDLLTAAQRLPQSNVLYPGPAGPAWQSPIQWANLQAPTQYGPDGSGGGPNTSPSQNLYGHGFGPEYTLGQTLSSLQGNETVGIVKYSGGTNLHDHWQPTFAGSSSYNPYNELMSRVNQSLAFLPFQHGGDTGTVAGFFWMQGEADAQDQRTTQQYETDLINFIAQVRADLGNPNLPFVYGLINDAAGSNDQIRQAQMDVASNVNNGFADKVPNTYLVNTDSFQRDSSTIVGYDANNNPVYDTVHFTNQGEMDLGAAMAQGYMSILARSDIGDTRATAQDLGTLAPGSTNLITDQLGNGPNAGKDVDFVKFTLTSAQTLTFDVAANSVHSPLDSYLRLFNAAGQQIDSSDDQVPTTNRDPYLTRTLAPGTYYVGLSGNPNRLYNPDVAGSGVNGGTGAYTFTIATAALANSWSPVITAAPQFNGSASPTTFGRYVIGSADLVPDVVNPISAYVTAPGGFTTTAVTFDANFDGVRDAGDYTATAVDVNGAWVWPGFDPSRLSGNKTLRIWAQESGGAWSAPISYTIDTLALPAWMDPSPSNTHITFDAPTQRYHLRSFIGKRWSVTTPASLFPNWIASRNGNPTTNDLYFGTLVEGDYSLAGKVVDSQVEPVLGFSVFGYGSQLNFGTNASSNIQSDAAQLLKSCADANGSLLDSIQSPTSDDIGKLTVVPPAATASWSQGVALNDDLTLASLQQSFSVQFNAANLYSIKLPSFSSPLGATAASVTVNPELGFAPYITASWTTALNAGQPTLTQGNVSLGAQLTTDLKLELRALASQFAGGVQIASSGGVAINASRNVGGDWSFAVPANLNLDASAIGRIGWGSASGKYELSGMPLAISADLSQPPPHTTPGAPPPPPTPTVLSPASAVSSAGDIAVGWVQIDPTGAAQPLLVQIRSAAGTWGSAETVASSNHFRGDPALAYLPNGNLLAVWSESTLDAAAAPGMDPATVASAQELYYAVRTGGTWSAPQAITSDGLLDDQPSLAVTPDGTAILLWRHASTSTLASAGDYDLYSASFSAGTWSAAAPVIDDARANASPSLAALASGDVLATWLSTSTASGDDAVVKSAVLHAGAWSLATTISDTTTACRQDARIVALPDGRALALWTEQTDAGQIMRSAVRDAAGVWGAPAQVLAAQKVIGAPLVSVHGSRIDIVWHGVGQHSALYAISRDFAGSDGWTTPRVVTSTGEPWWPMGGDDASGNLALAYAIDGSTTPQTALLSNLPDLSVSATGISLSTTPPAAGASNPIHVTVTNNGLAASPASTVKVYDGDPALGGTLIGSAVVSALGIGQSTAATVPWTPTTGTHQLYVVVDPDMLVAELDETNNTAVYTAVVLPPPMLSLAPASDTGTPGDGWTIVTTPTIQGTANSAASVAIYVDSQTTPVTRASVTSGTYTATLPTLANGPHNIWAQSFDAAGNPSAMSAPLSILIDVATEPPPPAPSLHPSTDSGTVGDGLTNFVRPKLTGVVKPYSTVTVFDAGTALGTAVADSSGTFIFTPSSDLATGPHTFTISQVDPAGNASIVSAPYIVTIDITPPAITAPTLAASSDTGISNSDRITTATNPTFTGTAEPGSTVWVFSDGSVDGIGTTDVNGNYAVTMIFPMSAGTHSITAYAIDAAGNISALTNPPLMITIDLTPPTVTSITRAGSNPTGAASIAYTVNFSKAVTGVDTSDFALAATGTAGGTISNVTGSGATYTVTVTGVAGNGTLGLNLVDDDTIQDIAGNALGGTGAGNGNFTGQVYTIDTTPPAVSVPVLSPASDSGSSSTDGITNVTLPTFTGTAEAASTIRIFSDGTQIGTGVATAGGTYSINATTALTNGSHNITATATDAAGNTSPATSPLVITIDTTAPTVSSITRAGANPTGAATVAYTATFAEPVTGVDATDFALAATSTATGTISNVTGSGATYTITVTGVTGNGTLGLNLIDDDSIQDIAGNPLGGTGAGNGNFTGQAYDIDTTPPAVTTPVLAAASDSGVSNTDDITNVTLPTFTGTAEAASTVRIFSDGTQIGSGLATAGGTYNINTTTALTSGPHNITATATDAAGNASVPTAALVVTIDTTAPTVSSIIRTGSNPTNATSVGYQVTFSEPVTGVATTDFALALGGTTTGTISSVTGAGATYTITVTAVGGNGALGLNLVDDDSIQDIAGNALGGTGAGNGNFTGQTYDIDTAPPAVSVPALAAASDSGVSNSDDITNVTLPTFTGAAEAGSTVHIFSDGTQIGSGVAAADGTYSINAATALTSGSHSITATATDAVGNTSALTSPLSILIDTAAPTSNVLPLPAVVAPGNFTVSWIGQDQAGGSGIASFDLFVATDGGAFAPWLTATTLTSSNYAGLLGHTYSFYSVAHDVAGNTQPAASGSAVSTRVAAPLSLTAGNIYVRKDADGLNLDLWLDAATPGSGAPTQQALINGITDLHLMGTADDDTLTLDLPAGNPLLGAGAITYDGAAGNNTLMVLGTSGSDTVTATTGGVSFTSDAAGFTPLSLSLTGVQTLRLPGVTGGSDAINVNSGSYTLDADTPSGSPNVAVTVASGAAVAFTGNQHLASLTLSGGQATIAAATRKTLSLGALSITGNGKLDLENNDLLITTGGASAAAAIRGYLTSAFGVNQDWTGPGGITSSTSASANPGKYTIGYANGDDQSAQDAGVTTAGGAPLAAGQVLVRPVLIGDANLDGTVDFFDITQVLGYAYNSHQPASYTDGDLDYSGQVDFFDIAALLSANYNTHEMFPTAVAATPLAQTIQAEDFDKGGEGVAYHDTTPQNEGGQYRTSEGVDIEKTTDVGGGYDVGWTHTGEWMNYTVQATTGGQYDFDARVANFGAGGSFHVNLDTQNVTGTLAVPNTGGFQTFTDVLASNIPIAQGYHVVQLVFDGQSSAGFSGNINWLKFTLVPSNSPWQNTPATLPGTVQAENYDLGGEGIAYHDTTPANEAGAYRPTEGVDIESLGAGNYAVDYTHAGEWMKYTVKVTATGTYTLSAHVSNFGAGGAFHIEVDGVNVTGTLAVPDTHSFTTFTDVQKTGVALSAGQHVLRFVWDANSPSGFSGNLDSFRATATAPAAAAAAESIIRSAASPEEGWGGGVLPAAASLADPSNLTDTDEHEALVVSPASRAGSKPLQQPRKRPAASHHRRHY
jgi:hypothetical protein